MNAAVSIAALLDANPIVGERRRGSRRLWTTREIAILRERWSADGIAGCLPLLPGRSAHAIYAKALAMGIAAPETMRGGRPRRRYETTEFIDRAIRAAYAKCPEPGDIRRLSATLIRPRQWIRRRAIELGCAVPRFRASDWSEAEIEIIRDHATKTPEAIVRILRGHGFRRSPIAVMVRLKRSHISRADPDRLTARGLAVLLGTDEHAVLRLIRNGLSAQRDKSNGAWQIRRRDLKRYIAENPLAIDIRRADPVWLIELLTGSEQ